MAPNGNMIKLRCTLQNGLCCRSKCSLSYFPRGASTNASMSCQFSLIASAAGDARPSRVFPSNFPPGHSQYHACIDVADGAARCRELIVTFEDSGKILVS